MGVRVIVLFALLFSVMLIIFIIRRIKFFKNNRLILTLL